MKIILVLLSIIYGIIIVEGQDNDSEHPVIYVTPYSVNKDNNETKKYLPKVDHSSRVQKENKRNSDNLFDVEPELYIAPPFPPFVKRSAKRNVKSGSIRSGRASPPATSYGTPYNDVYNIPNVYLPPSGTYGPPFNPPPTTTTEAPTTTSPPKPTTTVATEESTSSSEAEISGGYQYLPPQPEKIILNRNIYFYKPSDDFNEQPSPQQPINLPPPQRNVKVIFIKAPTFVAQPQVIPVLQQNEEKTLVYVLAKKPEVPEIVVPTAPPAKVSQPEVYFVKYGVKTDEKQAYGVPQYGKGYSYDTPGTQLKDGEVKSDGSSEENDSKSSESDEKTKKRRSSVRRNRSSDGIANSDPVLQFNRYYSSLVQRSGALER